MNVSRATAIHPDFVSYYVRIKKKFGIKITQEGVEDIDEFGTLEKMGCDVIQGYFFAKPMKYIDYCEFVNTNFPKP